MKNVLLDSLYMLQRVVFPPTCPSCGVVVMSAHHFCATCFEDLDILPPHVCIQCGYEAEELLHENHCASCVQKPPIFQEFQAYCYYNDFSSKLIARLKFSDHLHLIPAISHLMASKIQWNPKEDIITSVPMHYRRFLYRRYNQSAEIARHIAKKEKVNFIPDLVIRNRATKPQLGQTGRQRRKNLKNAFHINPKYKGKFEGKRLILLDDVVTTGTTIKEVCQSIKKEKITICILSFCRVKGKIG